MGLSLALFGCIPSAEMDHNKGFWEPVFPVHASAPRVTEGAGGRHLRRAAQQTAPHAPPKNKHSRLWPARFLHGDFQIFLGEPLGADSEPIRSPFAPDLEKTANQTLPVPCFVSLFVCLLVSLLVFPRGKRFQEQTGKTDQKFTNLAGEETPQLLPSPASCGRWVGFALVRRELHAGGGGGGWVTEGG